MNSSVAKMRQTIVQKLKKNLAVLGTVLLAGIGLGLLVPEFFLISNILIFINQSCTTAFMALGLTFCLITGGNDLSCPCVMAFSAMLGADVMIRTQSVILGAAAALLAGAGMGLLNGFAIAKLKMIPMIVTLSTCVIAEGLASWYTGSVSLSGFPGGFVEMFSGNLFGAVPAAVLVLLLFSIGLHLLLTRTRFGRGVYAIGISEPTARVNGVDTDRILLLVYILSGVMSAVAGIMLTARLNAASPAMGTSDMFLDIICAAVIGGTSVQGGKGSIAGTVFGALLMGAVSNIMNLFGTQFYYTYVIKGLIIVIACYLDVVRNYGRKEARG